MIITITPNPSFDRTIALDELHPGEVHRALSTEVELGGKGINVTRALLRAGFESVAVAPAGSTDRAVMVDLAAASDIPTTGLRLVTIAGQVRSNITVLARDGETTKLNEPGPVVDSGEIDDILAVIADMAARSEADSSWLAGCGSLPLGMTSDFYRSLVKIGETYGVPVAVDSSGPALAAAVEAGCNLIKPNHEELGQLVGHPLLTVGDAIEAAKGVVGQGVDTVLVTLGGDGALLVDSAQTVFGTASSDRVVNTVGAGDAFLAGALSAGGYGPDALAEGLAWGRAAVRSPQTSFPAIQAEDRALAGLSTEIDLSIELTE